MSDDKVIMTGQLHPRPGDTGTSFTVTERQIEDGDVYDIQLVSGFPGGGSVVGVRGLTPEKLGVWLIDKVDY